MGKRAASRTFQCPASAVQLVLHPRFLGEPPPRASSIYPLQPSVSHPRVLALRWCAAQRSPPSALILPHQRYSRPRDAQKRRLAQKWIERDFPPVLPSCERPSHLRAPGQQQPKALLGVVTCYFPRSRGLIRCLRCCASARTRLSVGFQGGWGSGGRRALLCGFCDLQRFARTLSVPGPSDAIVPAPSADQRRRAPIPVCRVSRAGRKFVSPVTSPFFASLILSASVRREIRGPRRVG